MAGIPISDPDRVRTSILHIFVCVAIAAMGAVGASAWILRSPGLAMFLGTLPMVFDTGLCFLLTGVALLFARRPGVAARNLRTALAIVPMMLCATVLLEFLLDRSLGVDLEFLHTWYDYDNKSPGRMAPNTALGFVLGSSGILLADRVSTKRRGIAVILLTFSVLGIGLTGLVGFALTPDLLFEWSRSARMAVSTAAGFVLCSIALRPTWSESPWYATHRYFREDEKIRLLGPATLIVITITAALAGFARQQNAFQHLLASKLESTLRDRRALFTGMIEQRMQAIFSADRLARLSRAGQAILLAPESSGNAIGEIETEIRAAGLRGVAVVNVDGVVVREVGDAAAASRIAAPLGEGAELLWDGGLIVRATLPVVHGGKRIGSIVADQSTNSLGSSLFYTGDLGLTGEIAVCIQRSSGLSCFPGSSRHLVPFTVDLSAEAGRRLPMQLGIAGQTGNVSAIDYRGHNVMAAYGLLAPGIGIVVKQDTAELYAAIRQSLQSGLPLLLLVTLIGATMLYLQLKPLTRQLLASEARATERELQMRTVIETVAEGIFTFDAHGLIEEVNPAVGEIFGYEACELIGSRTSKLMPDKCHDATYGRLHEDSGRGLGILAGQRNVKLSARRKDGSEFPLELTIRESNFSGTRSFVAIARDITERMDAERQLTALGHYDSLTALPNRSLFLERLKSIAASMDGARTAIALMFIDVDGFKNINDKFGHRGGDDLLIQVALRLSSAVRDCDVVARLSGDEFTVILQGLSEPRAESRRVADKIIVALRQPFLLSGHEVNVTVSLGLVIQESGGFNTADLLARADAAMYAAKRAGKDQVVAA